jgi:hypothetical protein
MCNLSSTYFYLQRVDEALELQQKALILLRLVLDENDPSIGLVQC